MSIYVDESAHHYGHMIMCHLVADTEEEMHAMADKISMDRRHL